MAEAVPTASVEQLGMTDLLGNILLSKIPGLNADKRVFEFIQKNPEIAEVILANYQHTAAEIQTEADLGKLNIELKIGLLIASWFSGEFLDKNLEKVPGMVTIPEVMRDKVKNFKFAEFKAFHEKATGSGLKWAGDTRALWTDRTLFDMPTTFALLKNLKLDQAQEMAKWPDFFPYVPGTRMVLPQDSAGLDNILKTWGDALQQCGVRLTTVAAGAAAPAADEIQLVAMKDTDPMDWNKVKGYSTWWEDTAVPTQFSGCPKTLAALLKLEDQKSGVSRDATALCEAVGYKFDASKDKAFLDWLNQGPQTNP